MAKASNFHQDEAPLCQCGCGEFVERRKNGNGWCTYAMSSCRTRAFRNRNAEKVYRNRNVPVAEGQAALAAIETVAKSYGINRGTLQKAVDRLSGRGEIPKGPDRVTNDYLVKELEQLASRIVASIDDYDIITAPLEKKTTALRTSIELRQLLKGEPTEIRSYADRSRAMARFELLVREAERRGLTLTLPADEYTETT